MLRLRAVKILIWKFFMNAKNPRINITFDPEMAGVLADLALKQGLSTAGLVRELALEALELREDVYFSNLAAELDQPGAKTFSHQDAWK